MKLREIRKLDFREEAITSPGSQKNGNEDALLSLKAHGLFGVFDGATSLVPYADKEGRTGGYLASHIAREAFESAKPDFTSMLADANDAIHESMRRAGIDTRDKLNLWVTSASVVRLHADRFDWLNVSDSLILVINKDGTHRLLVEDYEHDLESLSLLKRRIDDGDPNARQDVEETVREVRRQLNVAYGFIAGEPEVRFVYEGTESLDGVKDILIFSDGMIPPKQDPSAPDDFDAIVREYKKGGLQGWLDYVRGMENSDPDLRKYPRFKPHDDATAIAITFS